MSPHWIFTALKTRFIVNPISGNMPAAMPFVAGYAAAHHAAIKMTEYPGHAIKLAMQALDDHCELVVAVGGDGTMNEVASVLVGSEAILGLIPCGSGDGLGRHLGIHRTPEWAMQVIDRGRPRRIDTGIADGRPFFTAAGIGFEAEVAHRFNKLHRRGFRRYLTTAAKTLREWVPQRYTISSSAGTETVEAFTLAACNANQYGNDARIAPDAQVDDGLLDLCTLPPVTTFNLLPLGYHLFRGRIDRVKGVLTRRDRRFIVERESPGLLHTDGELHRAGCEVEFLIRPASLTIMAPPLRSRESVDYPGYAITSR